MKTRSVLLLTAVLLATCGAFSQDHCMPMLATGHITHPLGPGVWSGNVTVTFGQITLDGQVSIAAFSADNPPTDRGKGTNAVGGTELATFTFAEGQTLLVLSHYEVQHMVNGEGVFHVNEAGKIIGGTGSTFEGVLGATTSHGAFWLEFGQNGPTNLAADMVLKGTICWR
jgi:uncharacterized membrane protein